MLHHIGVTQHCLVYERATRNALHHTTPQSTTSANRASEAAAYTGMHVQQPKHNDWVNAQTSFLFVDSRISYSLVHHIAHSAPQHNKPTIAMLLRLWVPPGAPTTSPRPRSASWPLRSLQRHWRVTPWPPRPWTSSCPSLGQRQEQWHCAAWQEEVGVKRVSERWLTVYLLKISCTYAFTYSSYTMLPFPFGYCASSTSAACPGLGE